MVQVAIPFFIAGLGMVAAGVLLDHVKVGHAIPFLFFHFNFSPSLSRSCRVLWRFLILRKVSNKK